MLRRPRHSALLCVCALAAVLGCRDKPALQYDAAPAMEPTMPTRASPSKPVRIIYPAAPGSFVDLAADLRSSVVHIRSTTKVSGGPAGMFPGGGDDYALGSGFLLDTQGHILTNQHVIANAHELRVVLHDNVERVAVVLGSDTKLDIALLKIDANPRMKPARLGDSDQLQVGEWIVALGNPFGDELTVSAGIISAVGRTSQDGIAGPSPYNFRSFLRTDAAIDPGNSGGPLVNTAGEVVGIATAATDRKARAGFAVPINRIKPLIPMLKDGEVTRAWLGIFIHPVTQELAQQAKLEEVTGAYVSEVIPGGPAARAGIKARDIILEYNKRSVDHKTFPHLAAMTGINQRVPVTVWRNGKKLTLELISEAMPK